MLLHNTIVLFSNGVSTMSYTNIKHTQVLHIIPITFQWALNEASKQSQQQN